MRGLVTQLLLYVARQRVGVGALKPALCRSGQGGEYVMEMAYIVDECVPLGLHMGSVRTSYQGLKCMIQLAMDEGPYL